MTITLKAEGPQGCGKTTALEHLKKSMLNTGIWRIKSEDKEAHTITLEKRDK